MGASHDYSFGVIPLAHVDGAWSVCLVRHVNGGHWALPKGHKEEGEREQEAALRELSEETGITSVRLLEKTFLERYTFVRRGQEVRKEVRYWVGICPAQSLKDAHPAAADVSALRWCGIQEALSLLTYPQARTLVLQATSFLRAQKDAL